MGIDKVGIAPLGFADAEGKNCKLATAEDRSAKIRIVANAICFIGCHALMSFVALNYFAKSNLKQTLSNDSRLRGAQFNKQFIP